MMVELTLKEQPGPLHLVAVLDIIVLVMLLGFAINGMAHRAGVPVRLAGSSFRVAVEGEAAVLTIKGTSEPVYYLDGGLIAEDRLLAVLRDRRERLGLRMVLVKADMSLPAHLQRLVSERILAEGLNCAWLAEPMPNFGS